VAPCDTRPLPSQLSPPGGFGGTHARSQEAGERGGRRERRQERGEAGERGGRREGREERGEGGERALSCKEAIAPLWPIASPGTRHVHGACMVPAWCLHGACMVPAWCLHGACMVPAGGGMHEYMVRVS
jgi:hypothetical protein